MMRYNIATTPLVAERIRTDPTDWKALVAAVVDADRVLPGGITLRQLAGDEYKTLATDIENHLGMFEVMEARQGRDYVHVAMATITAQMRRDWFGTPWWLDLVDVFIDSLADPDSDAWRYDDQRAPEPASVADREALRVVLVTEPESLDDDAIYWCLGHGLGRDCSAGLERWRQRRPRSA
jgi:hypothetical protein